MASTSAQSLLYDALELDKRSIRLIKLEPRVNGIINCRLAVTNLDNKLRYTALSYTWGPPSYTAKTNGMTAEKTRLIICNDIEIRVTENLYHFLCRVYRDLFEHSQYFWIDAISINQEDRDEKSREVQKMTEIYRSASDLVIWLGESDQHTHDAIELIQVLAMREVDDWMANEDMKNPFILDDPDTMARVLGDHITPAHWVSLAMFFQRTWFSRVWIIQEVIMSENISVWCGGYRLAWEEELQKVSVYWAVSKWTRVLKNLQEDEDALPVGMGPWILGTLKAMLNSEEGYDLADALILTRAFDATERIDHVFGLLGLINEHASSSTNTGTALILPDYRQSPAQIFTLVAKQLILASNSLAMLCEVTDEQFRQLPDLPSWAPDWSVSKASQIARLSDGIFSAVPNIDQQIRFEDATNLLHVTGACLDTISLMGAEKSKVQAQREGFPSWVRLLGEMEEFYSPTSQSRAEVFWRTLILDMEGDSPPTHPASATMEEAFCSWFTLEAAICSRAEVNSGNRDAMLAEINSLSLACREIPPVSDIVRWVEILDSGDRAMELSVHPSIHPFELSFIRSPTTAPFLTSQNFMGMGPASSASGDEVWTLPGCNVPVVLRKTAAGGIYKLMGEAYVHGFMHGEALDSQNLNFVDIAIN